MSGVVVMTTVSSTKHGVGFDVLICFITCVIYHSVQTYYLYIFIYYLIVK